MPISENKIMQSDNEFKGAMKVFYCFQGIMYLKSASLVFFLFRN